MRVDDIRALTGPNVYSHRPVLSMRLYLNDLAGKESREFPGFNEQSFPRTLYDQMRACVAEHDFTLESVRLKDVNGPRGGVDHVCRIKVVFSNLPSVVYEKQDVSLDTAVGGALAGAERAVRRTLQRVRGKPIRKRPPMEPVPLTKSCNRPKKSSMKDAHSRGAPP